MMHGRGKSSPVIVARKPANKADPETVSAAELVERRTGAEGNADQPATNRTQGRARVAASGLALALASIRQAAMLDCQYPRWEPYAGKLHVRVCAGGARQLASLPRLSIICCTCSGLLLCRFSDAGSIDLTTRSAGRRPKSAKARNRVKR
jgi:hypothetical protein